MNLATNTNQIEDAGSLIAPMPGKILKMCVNEGENVTSGSRFVHTHSYYMPTFTRKSNSPVSTAAAILPSTASSTATATTSSGTYATSTTTSSTTPTTTTSSGGGGGSSSGGGY